MKTFLFFLLAFLPSVFFAQSIERQVIASSGSFSAGTGLQLSTTVGETMVSTESSTSLILTQGFQQSEVVTTGYVEPVSQFALVAYPNPVKDQLNLQIQSEESLLLELQLTDLCGRRLSLPIAELSVQGYQHQTIDLSMLAAGMYLLRVSEQNGKVDQIIKIQKVN